MRDLFEGLEGAKVSWCLLRLPSNPAAPTGDVDLLVATKDVGRLRRVVEAKGFVAVPGRERPPALGFLGYDPGLGICLLLDVTDRVAFADGRVRTDVAQQVLDRCQWSGGARVPAVDDAFWLLLLHCLLDKQCVPERYRPRLKQLAEEATPHNVLAATVRPPADLLRNVRVMDWSRVEAATSAVVAPSGAAGSRLDRARQQTRGWLARLASVRLLRRRFGHTVVLSGGSTATTAALAAEIARSWPFAVRTWPGFPTPPSPPGTSGRALVPLRAGPGSMLPLRRLYAQLGGQLVLCAEVPRPWRPDLTLLLGGDASEPRPAGAYRLEGATVADLRGEALRLLWQVSSRRWQRGSSALSVLQTESGGERR